MVDSELVTELNLPTISENMLPQINNITSALGVPREVLASEDEIVHAWRNLPRELNEIPIELRDELLARMCIAISTGLFDGAINYIWNASIKNLREKVKRFGLNVVGQILDKEIEEKDLNEYRDAELLKLTLELNLISEDGYYFLDQCRDIRNNYSAAHPSGSLINDRELITFINRCAEYALSKTINPQGVDINGFIEAIKNGEFNEDQFSAWIDKFQRTHDAQREMLFGMLHGIYCDSSSKQETRLNAINICEFFKDNFTPSIKSDLVDRHNNYQTQGKNKRLKASRLFFEKLNMLSLLTDTERHSIISEACANLMSTHKSYNNFYNEPPFAKRLCDLAIQEEIPSSAKSKYVTTVLTCYVGNRYGVSNSAIEYYKKMIKNFSPSEIKIMFKLEKTNTTLSYRIDKFPICKRRFDESFSLLNEESIPSALKSKYKKILS